MAQLFSGKKRIRKHFGKIREVAEMPNLIEVQKSSYELFLNLVMRINQSKGKALWSFPICFPGKGLQ